MSELKHRTNINLYHDDYVWLNRRFGYGWTEKVRDIVHEWVEAHKPNRVLEEESVAEYIRDKVTRENPGKDWP